MEQDAEASINQISRRRNGSCHAAAACIEAGQHQPMIARGFGNPGEGPVRYGRCLGLSGAPGSQACFLLGQTRLDRPKLGEQPREKRREAVERNDTRSQTLRSKVVTPYFVPTCLCLSLQPPAGKCLTEMVTLFGPSEGCSASRELRKPQARGQDVLAGKR